MLLNKSLLQAWYVTVALNKTFAVSWIKQMKTVLSMACNNLKGLNVSYNNTALQQVYDLHFY